MPYQSGPAPAEQAIPLTRRLKEATAARHRAVEALPAMAALTSQRVTRDDYRAYLARIARVYASLEAPLIEALKAGLAVRGASGPELRPKLPALLADCADEGLAAPRCEPMELPASVSAAAGGLYVLEGATLGGRVIARHLRRHLPGGLPRARFLDFHGDTASAAWKAFSAELDALAADGFVAPQEAVDGACLVFEDVRRILAGAQ